MPDLRRAIAAVCVATAASAIALAASATALASSPAVPQNPYLAPNPFSNLHNDTWMSNVYTTIAGPTAGASAAYQAYSPSVCGSLLFDASGQIVSVCRSATGPQARIFDPKTLQVIATYQLPGGGATSFQDFTGGGYIYLDQHNHLWTTTRSQHLFELAIGARGFRRIADYNLSKVLARGDGITSALPDFDGNVWFVTKPGGVVGVIRHGSHRIRVTHADSEIENSFAVGSDGVYVDSERSLYRYGLGPRGGPVATWRATYPNAHIHKPGQVDAGSGTTPAILPGVKTGLVYTYVREPGASAQWAWAGLSLRTGRTAFTVPTGIGTLYNNNYASISLGPTGNAYLSTIGGLTELRRR